MMVAKKTQFFKVDNRPCCGRLQMLDKKFHACPKFLFLLWGKSYIFSCTMDYYYFFAVLYIVIDGVVDRRQSV